MNKPSAMQQWLTEVHLWKLHALPVLKARQSLSTEHGELLTQGQLPVQIQHGIHTCLSINKIFVNFYEVVDTPDFHWFVSHFHRPREPPSMEVWKSDQYTILHFMLLSYAQTFAADCMALYCTLFARFFDNSHSPTTV